MASFVDDLFSHGGWDGFGRSHGVNPFSSFNRQVPRRNPAAQQRSSRFEARRAPPPPPKSTSPKKSEAVIDIPITSEEDKVPSRASPAPAPAPAKKAKSASRVVFKSQDDAALKIQAVLRGFLVRHSKPLEQLRLIAAVRKKFAVFQERVADPAKMSAIMENKRERTAVSEGAMQLLLKLDSIITFQPYVRDARRALVRELQRFQDVFDEIEAKEKEREAKEREEKERERQAKEEEERMRQEEERVAEEAEIEVTEEATKEKSQDQGEEEGFPVDIEIVDAHSSHEDDYLIVKREDTPGETMDTEPESMIAEEEASGEGKAGAVETGVIDLTKKLMQDNAELKEMVSKCLDEIHRQNGLISRLGRRMRFLERKVGKRSKRSLVIKDLDDL